MVYLSREIHHLMPCVVMLCTLLLEAARFLRCCLRPPAALAAENLVVLHKSCSNKNSIHKYSMYSKCYEAMLTSQHCLPSTTRR